MSAVAVVTDTTSDIAPETAHAAGLTVVPLFVNFGSRSYLDGVDLDRESFYRLLATDPALPTTTQPTARMFEDAFAPLVAAGLPIVGVSHLAGHVYSAWLADHDLEPPYLALLVSGGHTECVVLRKHGVAERLAATRVDAAP